MSPRQISRAILLMVAAAMFVGAAFLLKVSFAPADPSPVADLPDPRTFQSGDFVWPKKKGAVIPYSQVAQPGAEQSAWERQRAAFVERSIAAGVPRDVVQRYESMSFAQFENLYFAPDAGPRTMSAGQASISVGHVGIIEIGPDAVPYVVEALPAGSLPDLKQGAVVRLPYSDWLKGREGSQVWHGRVRNAPSTDRAKIANEARNQLQKPYLFFNLNLNDDSGFYCSKLAWLSIWRALGIAPDDNLDPDRTTAFPPWYSPRQLTQSRHIELLHAPGQY